MAGRASGAKGNGRNPGQGPARVSRATRPGAEKRGDPIARDGRPGQAAQTSARPGQQATGKTAPGAGAPFPARGRGQSSAPVRTGSAAIQRPGGGSIFDRADARNRKLSQRNRSTS